LEAPKTVDWTAGITDENINSLAALKEYLEIINGTKINSGIFNKINDQIKTFQGVWTVASIKFRKGISDITSTTITKGLSTLSNTFNSVTRSIIYAGFGANMFGRQLQRTVMAPVKKSIKLFTGWDKSIGDISTSMAMLQAFGLGTTSIFSDMRNALTQLPMVGMQLQGAFGALSALFVNIGASVLPKLIPMFIDLVEVLSDIWKNAKTGILTTLDKLTDKGENGISIWDKFLEVLKIFGEAGLSSFIQTISGIIEWIAKLRDEGSPIWNEWAATLGRIGGIFLALSPVLMIVGTAILGLALPLQGISLLLSTLSSVILPVITNVVSLGASLLSLSGYVFAPFVYMLAGLILHFKELIKFFTERTFPTLGRLGESIGYVSEGFGGFGGIIKNLKTATLPVKYLFMGLILVFEGLIDTLMIGITIIGGIVEGIGNLRRAVADALPKIGKRFDKLRERFKWLGDISNKLFGNSIGTDIAYQMDLARASMEDMNKTSKTMLNSLHGWENINLDSDYIGVPAQNTYSQDTYHISVEFSGAISPEVNIEDIAHQVSLQIAEDLQRI